MRTPPNIVLIMTDQHALHALSCHGAPICRTPNIDSLAEDGLRFTRAHTPAALCAPARTSLFSGMMPHQHGVRHNEFLDRPDLEYFPRQLQKEGYRLGYAGKWHVGTVRTAADMGFEGWGPQGYGGVHHDEHYQAWLKARGRTYSQTIETYAEGEPKYATGDSSGYTNLDGEDGLAACIAETTSQQIESFADTGQPFFVMTSFWGPHAAYLPPHDYRDLYDPDCIPEWPSFRDDLSGRPFYHRKMRECVFPGAAHAEWSVWAQMIARYYAYATYIDAQIGRILDTLKKRGLYEDSLIVFTSDHGDTIGIHGGAFDKGGQAYEELYRIPLLVKLPRNQCAGELRKQFTSLLDIGPTLCGAAGATLTRSKGNSLWPYIHDPAEPGPEIFVAQESGHRLPAHSRILWWQDLKYVMNFADTDELYDLERDPAELRNRIADPEYADRRRDLQARLLEDMLQARDNQGPQWRYFLERPMTRGLDGG